MGPPREREEMAHSGKDLWPFKGEKLGVRVVANLQVNGDVNGRGGTRVPEGGKNHRATRGKKLCPKLERGKDPLPRQRFPSLLE